MSKKLLLADDSITIQKVIQITFAHEDYELTIVDNGDTALAKAREVQPDLVLADVYMPGKNGYELARAIKQDPALQHVPVLLLAGSFEPFDEEKAVSCKAEAWIEKPFESQNLIDKVAELLRSAAAAPQPEAVPVSGPAEVADVTFDEPVFEESLPVETGLTAEEDPFADISFEEETPAGEEPAVTESTAMTDTDDWSDVLAEPAAEPAVTEAAAEIDSAPDEGADDIGGLEEQPEEAEKAAPAEEADFAAADAFDMGEDDIMPLEDEDILGAEDLEPIMEEQTLTPWSRAESDVEDFFGGPVEEEVSFEEFPPDVSEEAAADEELQMPVAEEPIFGEEASEFLAVEPVYVDEPAEVAAEEPALEEDLGEVSAQEPAAVESDWLAEEPPLAADETVMPEEPTDVAEPAVEEITATASAAEVKAATISEAEIEAIIERVVNGLVEKLAGTIVERVAWEVVPDLADTLIREEIRKIKDAAA